MPHQPVRTPRANRKHPDYQKGGGQYCEVLQQPSSLPVCFGIYIGDDVPFVWGLHVLVFVVWFPTIFMLLQNPEIKELRKKRSKNPFAIWAIAFKETPKPIILLVIIGFVYPIVSFFIFMQTSEGGEPNIIDGQYVLTNHGDIIREITEKEYHSFQVNKLRGFSGIWIAFYSMAMGLLPRRQEKG